MDAVIGLAALYQVGDIGILIFFAHRLKQAFHRHEELALFYGLGKVTS